MKLTASDLRPSTRPPQRAVSPIRQMYQDNIELIKELAETHTHAEACVVLEARTGVASKGPTLLKFCQDKEISFDSSLKKARAGRLGGIARWKNTASEKGYITTSN